MMSYRHERTTLWRISSDVIMAVNGLIWCGSVPSNNNNYNENFYSTLPIKNFTAQGAYKSETNNNNITQTRTHTYTLLHMSSFGNYMPPKYTYQNTDNCITAFIMAEGAQVCFLKKNVMGHQKQNRTARLPSCMLSLLFLRGPPCFGGQKLLSFCLFISTCIFFFWSVVSEG